MHISTFKSLRLKSLFFMTLIVTLSYAASSGKIIINEFMALNSTIIQDEDGDYSDWIELYNPGDETINLQGWYLTDNSKLLRKWPIPAVTIGSGEYRLIFASGKDRAVSGKELHTNFSLSGSGEYLGIVEPDMVTISHEYAPTFPPQQSDISYGIYTNQATYFSTPTPGSANELSNQALAPVFSVERGFFSAPFSVALSIGDPDTKIYYTTDGTIPTTASTLYSEPINISTTTPLSAVGIKDGNRSQVVSNTYLFINNIVNQPKNPEGYPSTWGILNMAAGTLYARGERVGADYEMDKTVCNDPTYQPLLEEAFKSIPTVSIVTTPGYIFSHTIDNETGGIYIYTGDTGTPSEDGGSSIGREWERPASIEYFDPKTNEQFQINCGLRLHGGNSRKQGNSLKHSFRVSFRKEYGAGKLRYELFDDKTATDKFDHLVFRAGHNYSWIHNNVNQRNNAQYILDSFTKRSQLDMGNLAPHDKFVHLYLNGLYWGLYDISEKINDNFLETYLGGEESDYDVINDDYVPNTSNGIVDGNDVAYNQMLSLGKNGKYEELLSSQLLNMENYIDYILLNFYIGNMDWDKNNWFTGRNRVTPEKGFCFYTWDAENCLTDVNLNKFKTFEGPLREIFFGHKETGTNGGLYVNAKFKQLICDRLGKHFLNGGALTPENTIARYEELADEIDLAIITESARWGDMRKTLNPNDKSFVVHTRNDHWLARKEDLLTNYFPLRTEIVLEQFKEMGLYPSTNSINDGFLDGKIDVFYSDNTLYYKLHIDGELSIDIYTADGRKVAQPESGFKSAGEYYISPRLNGNGVYLYRIVFNGEIYTGKFVNN